jgi:acetylornithine deacetylase
MIKGINNYIEKSEDALCAFLKDLVRIPTIKEACKSVSDLKVDVRTTLRIEPCLVDPVHPFVEAFASTVRSVRRNPVQFVPTTGFTDLHFFVEEGKMPGVGYGARGKGAHGVNERIRISDLIKTVKTYAMFMAGAEL